MQYILLFIILTLLACRKSKEPERLTPDKPDSVEVFKENNTWFVLIQVRAPTDYHRRVKIAVHHSGPVEVHYVFKIPAGQTEVKKPLTGYGEVVRWEVLEWGVRRGF